MYVPTSFREENPGKLQEFIKTYNFGTICSGSDGDLKASHLPFLLEEKAGGQGKLTGHMAKANDHWQSLAGKEVLVVFQGPHAYISPAWYEEPDTVPTWNYVAAHVYGKYVPVTEEGKLREILEKMVGFYETGMPEPWNMESLSKPFLEKMLKAIVGFEIDIQRIEGKWKLSQNHPEARRQKVVRALQNQGKPNALEIAKLMSQKDRT